MHISLAFLNKRLIKVMHRLQVDLNDILKKKKKKAEIRIVKKKKKALGAI